MRTTGKLTALKVDKLTVPGCYGDGGGLWPQVARGGTKSWLFRFKRDGRARQMGLGPVAIVSLAEARELARDARRWPGRTRLTRGEPHMLPRSST